jgi:3-hydroxybutyryl-CoA dehydrogenase
LANFREGLCQLVATAQLARATEIEQKSQPAPACDVTERHAGQAHAALSALTDAARSGRDAFAVGAHGRGPFRPQRLRRRRGCFRRCRRPRRSSTSGQHRRNIGKDKMSDITRIGVIGCGLMGAGIAEVCARAGLEVIVREIDDAAAAAGRDRIQASLGRAVKAGKLSGPDRDAALERLTVSTELSDLADRDLVIEAATENPEIKAALFAELDLTVKQPEAILATNTSSIPIVQVARATSRPAQVIGLHFFNPAPVQKLVEVIPSVLTGSQTFERARAFVTETLGKTAITAPDRSGFVVNALLVPYLLAAIRMLEAGHGTADDIDTGMVLGCAHPMGPLRLADLIGLDTLRAVADSMYEEFKEPLYAAPPLLRRMTDAGLLGRKADRGFYEYQ